MRSQQFMFPIPGDQMVLPEKALLLDKTRQLNHGLSTFYAAICIVDVFGVFPLVALPKSIQNCGTYGIFLLVSLISVQIYTAILLGKCWIIGKNIDNRVEKRIRCPYSALAEVSCGKRFAKFVTVLLNLTIFSAGVPNIIVASQNMELLGLRIIDFNFSYCYWIIIIGIFLCPILWLGSPKDMKCLCTLSVTVVISVFLLVIVCLFKTDNNYETMDTDTVENLQLLENFAIAYGVISFQFDIHPTILTIQVDMKNKRNVDKALILGFFITLVMFGFIYKLVCLKFGTNISESLLESLPTSIFLHLSAFLVAFQLGLSSAVSNSALYQQIEDSLGISTDFNYNRCILRSSLTVLGIVIAESVPRFDVVMSVIGGTLTGPLIFIFPPLFYIKMLHLKSYAKDDLLLEDIIQDPSKFKEIHVKYGFSYMNDYKSSIKLSCSETFEMCLCYLILIFGVAGTLTTAFVNLKNVSGIGEFARPCIYNLTVL